MSQPDRSPYPDPGTNTSAAGPSSAASPAPAVPPAIPEPAHIDARSHSPEPQVPATGDVQVTSPSTERIAFADDAGNGPGGEPRPRNGTYVSRRSGAGRNSGRIRHTSMTSLGELPRLDYGVRTHSQADYPTEVPVLRRTIAFRLEPTLEAAEAERARCTRKGIIEFDGVTHAYWFLLNNEAQVTGWALNIAIGLQVLLGSLTTGLSAVASQGNIAVSTVILGALSTLVASYLARARGSNEPELSITRTKDLEQFLRECRAFVLDHGHKYGFDGHEGTVEEQKEKFELEARVEGYRRRYEDLLGNASGERKLSPA